MSFYLKVSRQVMKEFLNKIINSYEIFCKILLLLMSSMVIIFVFLRYFFGITFVWAEEMITMLFISTTYFGAVIGMRYNEHINIGFFYDQMPEWIKPYIEVLNSLIIFGLQVGITIISFKWIGKVGNVLTNGMRLPIKYFYYMMPISCILIGIYCLFRIVKLLSHWNERSEIISHVKGSH